MQLKRSTDAIRCSVFVLILASWWLFVVQVWKQHDQKWATSALQHAKQLFAFGLQHPGCFSKSVPEMGAVYPSSAWRDDMAWGAAWLHIATQEPVYLQHAQALLNDSRSAEADR